MNIFVRMWHALWDIDAYKQFIKRKMSGAIGYAVIVCIITFVLTGIIAAFNFISSTGGMAHMIDTYIPNFTISEGRFSCDKAILEQDIDAGYYIDVDSSKDWDESSSDTKTLLRNFNSVIIVDSEKMIIKSDNNTQTFRFSEVSTLTINRDDLKKMIPYMYIGLTVAVVFMFFYTLIGYFVIALIVAAIGRLVAMMIKIRITMTKTYIMALYACGWPTIIIGLLNALLPIYIPWQSMWITIIASIYMGLVFARLSRDPEYKYQDMNGAGGGYQNNGYQNNGYQNNGYQNNSYQNSQNAGYQGTGYQNSVYGQTTDTQDDGDLKPNDGWSFGSSDSDGDDGHGR